MAYVKDPLLRHHNENTIFLMPSNYGEGLPRGILEAMSLEIPVIASKKACVGLFDNKTLFMAENNNIESYKKYFADTFININNNDYGLVIKRILIQ